MLRFKKDDGTDYPEWEEKKLGDCCQINPKTEVLDDKFYYIDLESVTNGSINLKPPINKLEAPSRAQRVLNVDDVLFQTVRPYQMNHYHFKELNNLQTVASTGFAQMKLKNGLNGFLYQLLYTDKFNYNVNIRCTGSNYPAINSTELSSIKISIPCIEEQQKIVNFLSSVDEVISCTEKELENLEFQKKGVIQKIFSQEVRFKDENGNKYPEWEEKQLGEIGVFYGGLSGKTKDDFGKGNSKYITYMNVYKNTFIKNNILESVKIGESEKQNTVNYGDLLFTQSSETIEEVGLTSVYLFNDKPFLNSFCIGFHLNNHLVTDPEYMGYLMRTEYIRKQIMREGQGISRINLSSNRILSIKLLLPSLEEQQKIADFLSNFDTAIECTIKELEQWKLIKKGLLQQMFK